MKRRRFLAHATTALAGVRLAPKITFAPHSPKADPQFAPFAQVIAVAQNVYGFQEFPANRVGVKSPDWYAPHIHIVEGKTDIPNGNGLGITYDETIFEKAEKL